MGDASRTGGGNAASVPLRVSSRYGRSLHACADRHDLRSLVTRGGVHPPVCAFGRPRRSPGGTEKYGGDRASRTGTDIGCGVPLQPVRHRWNRIGCSVSWRARLDSITADHISALRRTEQEVSEVDERARAATARMGEMAGAAHSESESPQERAAREAREERDRSARGALARTAALRSEKHGGAKHARDEVVLPVDWTDEDEARAEGYGPPKSWLT
ncbi:hypothetical protein J2W56_004987 [Nocardia kruczakiae]|uniref:Uncharacterized protein n=1 Tax=Nocardia kruczakiae TaxID=261477 RepID=A0ABU1XKY9_9NOCA|nr:hypothetical protein [Nocardia kruczakiae]